MDERDAIEAGADLTEAEIAAAIEWAKIKPGLKSLSMTPAPLLPRPHRPVGNDGMAKPETVVDYDAWNRGYMPPSEHILIDQLAYRGAKVIMSSDNGPEASAIWLVMRGKRPARKYIKALMTLMLDCLDDEEPAAIEDETA